MDARRALRRRTVKVAIDTNIIAYAEGLNDAERKSAATGLLRAIPRSSIVLPVQVLGELYHVLIRKGGWSRPDARDAVRRWYDSVALVTTSAAVFISALDLATDHRLSIWDSVIIAAAASADCGLLLSEDLQDGFGWHGVTVANPFATAQHPLLEALRNGSGP